MIHADLSKQRALVTGASRGIGAAIAKRLAANGAHVIVNFHGSQDAAAEVVAAIHEAGGQAQALGADVGDPDAVAGMFATLDAAGPLDILVNNAGITKDGLVATLRERDWEQVLAVDLGGVQRCIKAALRGMLRARTGRIVNVASVAAIHGGRGQANYAAAKAGVVALTRATALEVAERGIAVNAVLPGFIDTDMTSVLKRRAGDEIRARIPAGRYGQPEDVAGLVLYLCSEDASYLTGQAFVVDGGLTIG